LEQGGKCATNILEQSGDRREYFQMLMNKNFQEICISYQDINAREVKEDRYQLRSWMMLEYKC
jgi:hypothetical protein